MGIRTRFVPAGLLAAMALLALGLGAPPAEGAAGKLVASDACGGEPIKTFVTTGATAAVWIYGQGMEPGSYRVDVQGPDPWFSWVTEASLGGPCFQISCPPGDYVVTLTPPGGGNGNGGRKSVRFSVATSS